MHKRYQSGAVSLFLVVFATLLITVVTVSFLRNMLQDQLQATNLDLSQSAYDSAQAGVQDAERALLRYITTCTQNASDCADARTAIDNSANCNEALSSVVDTTGKEVTVQQSATNNLDQAYTCVTIDLNTPSVVGSIAANQSKMISLIGESDFDTIQIDWFNSDDLGASTAVAVTTATASPPLLSNKGTAAPNPLWKPTRPSLLRAQLIQYSASGFKLSDFDANSGSDRNTSTLFLYPSCTTSSSCTATPNVQDFASNARIDPTAKPINTNCVKALTSGGYACSQRLTLPNPVGGDSKTRTAFLNLKPLYNATHYKITLLKGSGSLAPVVNFSGVQPIIDSTGRANDIFRRVKAHVDLTNADFPYPSNAVDITGSFCKSFAVTDDVNQYVALKASDNTTTCTP